MKYKYIKRNEVKKKLSYICRSRGVSLQTKADMFRAIDNLPYTVESELENTIGSDWISCEERMPDEGEMVLVFSTHKEISKAFWDSDMGKFFIADSDYHYNQLDITHWQPLPEPPKGE